MKTKKLFGFEKAFFVSFIATAIPVIIQVLMLSSRNLSDVLMVGTLGQTEVAAVGIVSKAMMISIVLLVGLSSGCGVLAAQYWGANDLSGVKGVLGLSFGMAFVLVVLPVLLFFTANPAVIMGLATSDVHLANIASKFLGVISLSVIFLAIVNVFGVGLRAIGQASTAMYFSIGGVALNVLLNYLLIFGKAGFPQLGIMGAAYATLISSVAEALLLTAMIYFTKHPLAFVPNDFIRYISKDRLVQFVRISVLATVNGFIWSTGIFLYHVIYGKIGTEALAVMSMMATVDSFSAAFEQGCATATAVLLGHTLGQQRFNAVIEQAKGMLIISLLLSLALGSLLLLFYRPIIGLYGAIDDSLIDTAFQVYLIMALTFWLKTINAVGISGVLRSGGDLQAGLVIDFTGQWLIGIPLALVGAFVLKWSLPQIFILVIMEDLVKACMTLYRIRQGKWVRNLVTVETREQTYSAM